MPKILRILNRFNLGGPVYNASYLSEGLAPEYETLLIGGKEEPGELSALYIPESQGIQPRIIPSLQRSISFKTDRQAYRDIREIIQSFQPDIVHTHASKAGAIGRMAASKENVPVIVHTFHGHVFHSYFHPAKTALFKRLERRLAKQSTAIIAISDLQKKELCEEHRIVSPDKTHVIPLGFELERFGKDKSTKRAAFRSKWGIDDDTIAIGIVGRLAPVKNHQLFLRAIQNLKSKTDKHIVGVVIGDGELKSSLVQQISDLGLNAPPSRPDIVFTSWITDMTLALPGLDIVALTSLNEGTPVSLIEAQAAGVPVVTTNVGGVMDVISDKETGYVVPTFDEDDFAHHLKLLCEDQELRESFGTTGITWSNERFGKHRLVEDIRYLYRQFL